MVAKHHIVLDFGYHDERNACLLIWASAVPEKALPKYWQEGYRARTQAMRQQLEGTAGTQTPRAAVLDDEEGDDEQVLRGSTSDRAATSWPTDTEQVVKEGWLNKQGHMRPSWKRRYFRLTAGGMLKYYEEPCYRIWQDMRNLSTVLARLSRNVGFP